MQLYFSSSFIKNKFYGWWFVLVLCISCFIFKCFNWKNECMYIVHVYSLCSCWSILSTPFKHRHRTEALNRALHPSPGAVFGGIQCTVFWLHVLSHGSSYTLALPQSLLLKMARRRFKMVILMLSCCLNPP